MKNQISGQPGSVTILTMWKPSNRLNPVFEGDDPSAFYTKSEASRKLFAWIKKEGLDCSEKGMLKHNEILWKVILKQKKQKKHDFPRNKRFVSKQEVGEGFMNYLQKHQAVLVKGSTAKPKLIQGEIPKIGVYLEKRQGGRKHTTFVWNLEQYGIDCDKFAKDAQAVFAASTSV
eukprot:UN25021